MTHSGGKPHINVGDRGQRYEVRTTGYPKPEQKVVGWATTLEGADEMAAAFREHPSCTSTTIFDRQENKPVITRFAGILRRPPTSGAVCVNRISMEGSYE